MINQPINWHGRGTSRNPDSRFSTQTHHPVVEGDDWGLPDDPSAPRTQVLLEKAHSIITRNQSPDLPFSQSINPYRGCEHGCIYCYARPSHGYMDLSAGLDFETKIFAKTNAPELLRQALANPRYQPQEIVLGSNTDVYQPIERQYQITRQLLLILQEARHPVTIITKNALIERDLPILQDLAVQGLVQVVVSLSTLDADLARKMDPRAPSPKRRLQTMQTLTDAGVPVTVLAAPMIPSLNDADLERILAAAQAVGVRQAGYTLLRLPYELQDLFADWLQLHYPLKAQHVLNLLEQAHQDADKKQQFGTRMRGTGPIADLLRQRFRLACRRLGLQTSHPTLRTDLFVRPALNGQMSLF